MDASADIKKFAARFAALGHEARLEIVRRLLQAHPAGLVVTEIQQLLGIASSTLSHHLDALRREGLVEQHREGKFLRYVAHTGNLEALARYFLAECCGSSQLVPLLDLASGKDKGQGG
jgi:ArsR family transcriptional regulator, arsenate/arsenite/antimonite-responsive transcriptional repressor